GGRRAAGAVRRAAPLGRHPQADAVRQRVSDGAQLHRQHRDRPARPLHLRLRGGRLQVPARPRRRRGAAAAAVQRDGVHQGARRLLGRAGALAQGGHLPAAGGGVAGDHGPLLPRRRLDQGAPRHPGRPPALQGGPGPADLGRRPGGAVQGGRGGRPVSAPFPAFELARKVADAVLYEGYLLYPYRASAAKNQARWQFGVLMPRRWSEHGPDEPWATQTECLLEPEGGTTPRVLVRFLHGQAKSVEAVDVEAGTFHEVPALPVDGSELIPWDEATEQEVTVTAPLTRLLAGELVTPFERPGGAPGGAGRTG